VLERSFDARRTIDAIARERVTHIMTVPSQIIDLLRQRLDGATCTTSFLTKTIFNTLLEQYWEALG
jgi:non-ribosomal peptide synthetase component F